MRAVVQRVSRAKVTVNDKVVGEIGRGLLLLLGVAETDETSDAEYLAEKILNLRIFEDGDDKMNRSLLDSNCELLVVSQFTLYGDTRRGRRPTFVAAAAPDKANELYEYFVARSRESVTKVETGQFQAMMDVELVNDGPVTIILDSEKTI
jgi:D-tyrosyl-tRNA(Tyr) deacylase